MLEVCCNLETTDSAPHCLSLQSPALRDSIESSQTKVLTSHQIFPLTLKSFYKIVTQPAPAFNKLTVPENFKM